jgi:predicted SnoaL-like aldol condensation-catalyzing enzyme
MSLPEGISVFNGWSRRGGATALLLVCFVASGIAHASGAAADAAQVPVEHADWAKDQGYIDQLAHDSNPQYAANKRLVLDFEAALEKAQTVRDGEPGNFDEVVKRYVSPNYVQHDPSYPAGRDGLLGFFKMIQQRGERVSHPPERLVAEGDMVVLIMRRPPLPDPDHPGAHYTAYRISAWRVCGQQLCDHWSAGTKGNP